MWKLVTVFLFVSATAVAQSMSEEQALALYGEKDGSKAFASNGSGAWGVTFGAHMLSDALTKALTACEKNREEGSRPCQIIAEDATRGAYARQGLAMSPAAQNDYAAYAGFRTNGHKAFAISNDGPWGWAAASSITGAKSAALAECNALGEGLSPCVIVDLDGYRQRF